MRCARDPLDQHFISSRSVFDTEPWGNTGLPLLSKGVHSYSCQSLHVSPTCETTINILVLSAPSLVFQEKCCHSEVHILAIKHRRITIIKQRVGDVPGTKREGLKTLHLTSNLTRKPSLYDQCLSMPASIIGVQLLRDQSALYWTYSSPTGWWYTCCILVFFCYMLSSVRSSPRSVGTSTRQPMY